MVANRLACGAGTTAVFMKPETNWPVAGSLWPKAGGSSSTVSATPTAANSVPITFEICW